MSERVSREEVEALLDFLREHNDKSPDIEEMHRFSLLIHESASRAEEVRALQAQLAEARRGWAREALEACKHHNWVSLTRWLRAQAGEGE